MLIIILSNIILFSLCILVFFYRIAKREDINLIEFDINNSWITKGFLALAIVLCHFFIFVGKDLPFSGRWAAIGLPIVSVFFFISGYGLFYSYEKKGNDYLNSFFSRRLLKIVIPLIVVNSINLIADLLVGADLPSVKVLFDDFVNSSLYLWFSWYVYALLFSYLIFYIIFKFIKDKKWALGGMVVLILVFICWASYSGTFLLWRSTIFAFPLGMIYKSIERNLRNAMLRSKVFLVFIYTFSLFSFIALLIYMREFDIAEDPENIFGRIVVYSTPLAVIWISYVVNICNVVKRIINELGKISYEIYLLHGVVLGHYYMKSLNIILQLVLVYTIVIIGAFVIHKVDNYLFEKIKSL